MTQTYSPKGTKKGQPALCDVCETVRPPDEIRPFTLVRAVRRHPNGQSYTTRSYGSVDLCRKCWKSIAAPRRQLRNTHDPYKD